jgi:hypothetical protein
MGIPGAETMSKVDARRRKPPGVAGESGWREWPEILKITVETYSIRAKYLGQGCIPRFKKHAGDRITRRRG